MHVMLVVVRWGLVLVAASCGRINFDPLGGNGGSSATDGAGNGGAEGTGTVSGSAPGCSSFPQVAAAYVVGQSEVPGQTSIYVFSKPVACQQLAAPDWQNALASGTCTLELVAGGAMAGTYPITGAPPPAMGEGASTMIVTLSSGSITRGAMAGTLQLTAIGSGGSTGSFDIEFSTLQVMAGTFDAALCSSGTYP